MPGVAIGQTYSHPTFGFKCTLPSDWAYYDKDQLSELNSAVADMSSDEEIKEALQKGQAVIEMAAQNSSGQNINANVSKMDTSVGTVSDSDMAALVNNYVKQAPAALEKAYGWSGATATSSTVTFCGKSVPCADIEVTVSGQTIKMTQIYVVKDKYLMAITATDAAGGDPHQIFSYFAASSGS